MKVKVLLSVLLIAFSLQCSKTSQTEKFQKQRNNIINVSDSIHDIDTDLIFGNSLLYIIDDYLVLNEIEAGSDKSIHVFNKKTFKYIASSGTTGRGPGEIIIPGRIGIDHTNKILWAPDHAKRVMFKFPLDSILNNKDFLPTLKFDLNDVFIERFDFLNDSISLGKAVRVLSHNSFDMVMSRHNIKSNKIEQYGYEHPEATGKKSNSLFKLSLKNNIYVNCFSACDLMTICDLKGNLEFNIYGEDKMDNKNLKKRYYSGVDFYKDKIIASYIGDIGIVSKKNRNPRGNTPSKFLVFDIEGNYLQTIEMGHKFTYFCIDEENKRAIVYFEERKKPLGYFNLYFE